MTIDPSAPEATSRAPGRAWLVAAAVTFAAFLGLTAAVVLTGGVDSLDTAVHQTVLGSRPSWATLAAGYLTVMGWFPVVVAVAIVAAALLRRRTGGWLYPTLLVLSVGVTAAVVFMLKVAVGRARPSSDTLLGATSLDYSFPSGHTADGSVVIVLTCVLTALTLRPGLARRLVLLLGISISVGIGWTRIYLGYHWLTDVIGGWLLAASVVSVAGYCAAASGPAPSSFGDPPTGWRHQRRGAYVHDGQGPGR